MKKIYTFIFIINYTFGFGQIDITSVIPISPNVILKYEKFEVGIALNQSNFSNFYDPEVIDVGAEFKSPTNIITEVNGFYYQDFERCTNCPDPTIGAITCAQCSECQDPNYLNAIITELPWRIRFCPKEQGEWKYRIKVTANNSNSIYSSWKNLTVKGSNLKGYIRVAANKRNFEYEDGSFFYPIGMNTVDARTTTYNRLLYLNTINMMNKVFDSGGNLIRIWMSPWHFGIEWNESGIGNYDSRQNRAYDLDAVIENAELHNSKIQLCLMTSAELNFNSGTNLWNSNPYKGLISPTENPEAFFSDPDCIKMIKQRMRYIISRWGYSPAIFSYEIFNEVDLFSPNNVNGFWQNNNQIKIRNWHDNIIQFMKTMDNNHLYTTSTGSPAAGSSGNENSIFASNNISYVQDHYYGKDYNVEFQRNYLAIRGTTIFDKPYLLGEFGEEVGECWLGSSNFTADSYTLGNYFHDINPMHNSLWSTAFSGSAGPGLYWWSNSVFNSCWGGQWRYFTPLSKFWESENLLGDVYQPITNSCQGSGVKDQITNPTYPNNCYPIWVVDNQVNPSYIDISLATENDDKIEIFALKFKSRILGWMHNKSNYWYNLPHNSGPISNPICNSYNDNQPSNPNLIEIIDNKILTIDNIECDGEYRVEFFSTYPEYDTNQDGILDEGGIIPSLTINSVPVHCGLLSFTIPRMTPLITGPYAPDYAFKITQKFQSWQHNIITNNDINKNISGDISAGNNDIFYHGQDGRLHHYWYINGVIQHEWLTDWNNNSQNVNGEIDFEGQDVFYKGVDQRLHHYWNGPLGDNTGWHHEWLTDWSNSTQNVDGDISFSGTDVFFKGIDQRLHHYWYGLLGENTGWHHEWLTDWTNSTQNVGGDISFSGTDVFFKGIDQRLHHYWYGLLGENTGWHHEWLTDWSNSNQNVGGDIQSIDSRVYYKGVDNRLHEYYYTNARWNHRWITSGTEVSQNVNGEITVMEDGSHLFYKGADNFIHQLYKMSEGSWGHDWIICYSDLENSLKGQNELSVNPNGKLYYRGADAKIHSFKWNIECNSENSRKNYSTEYFVIKNSNEKELDSNIKPYPNPFIDEIFLINKGLDLISIELYDIQGNRILHENTNFSEVEIKFKTAFIASGIYVLKLFTESGKSYLFKMIKL